MEVKGVIAHVSDKGFGFIQVEGYDKNIFFHAKDLKKVTFEELRKGDEVLIDEIKKTEKGFSCKGVSLI